MCSVPFPPRRRAALAVAGLLAVVALLGPVTAAPRRRPATAARPRAVIDAGSSSLNLLVVDGTGHPIYDGKVNTSLGEGQVDDAPLARANQRRTLKGVEQLRRIALDRGVAPGDIELIATAAIRNATRAPTRKERKQGRRTGAEFVEELAQLGIGAIRILSGAEEAELGYRGALRGLEDGGAGRSRRRYLVIDTGGGSHQFVMGRGDRIEFRGSTQIGSNRVEAEIVAPLRDERGTLGDKRLAKVDRRLRALVPAPPADATSGRALPWPPQGETAVVLTGGFARFLRIYLQKGHATVDEVRAVRHAIARRGERGRLRLISHHADGTPLTPAERAALGQAAPDEPPTTTGESIPGKASLVLRLAELLDPGGDANLTFRLSTTDARHQLADAAR